MCLLDVIIKNLYRMYGMYPCAVKYLLPARCAGGRDETRHWISNFTFYIFHFPNLREQNHLTYGEGGLVVLLLIAKGTSHAATATWNDVDLCATQQAEGLDCRLYSDQCFLVTVAMQPYFHLIGLEV